MLNFIVPYNNIINRMFKHLVAVNYFLPHCDVWLICFFFSFPPVPTTVYPDTAAVSLPVMSSSDDTYEQYENSGRCLFAPIIPWDIVQR